MSAYSMQIENVNTIIITDYKYLVSMDILWNIHNIG